MRKWILCLGMAVVALFSVGGCRRAVIVDGPGPGPDFVVVSGPAAGHRCHAGCGCGNVWHGGRWHHNAGHRHGHGCGHHWSGTHWILHR